MTTKHQTFPRASDAPATELKQLLVGIDADGLADHALQAALQLARTIDANVEVVHAVGSALPHWEYTEDPRDTAKATGLFATATTATIAHVERLLTDLDFAGARAQDLVRVMEGPPAKVLLEEAQRLDADVVFLGTHRRRGVVDFGSTVRAVLAKAPKSVWIQTQPVRPIKRILVPVDLSDDSLRALSHAVSLAKMLGASVRAVHVFQSTEYMVPAWPDYPDYGREYVVDGVRRTRRESFETEMSSFDWRGVAHQAEYLEGEPIETILELAQGHDLIALGTHGRTGLASVLLGNVAYSVLKRSETPVWAIRHPERKFLTS